MNWYDKYCFAQIWVSDAIKTDSDSFADKLTALYELEYKRACLMNFPFAGMPQRRDNMLEKINERLEVLVGEVKDVLVKVYAHWLAGHALTNPDQWAKQRVAENDETGLIAGIIYEYIRYTNNNNPPFEGYMSDSQRRSNQEKAFRRILDIVTKNIDQYPSFKRFLEMGVLQDYRAMRKEDLSSEGLEEFGRMHNREFATEEEAEEYIDNMGIDDFDLMDGFFAGDIDSFEQSLSQWGILNDFATELYQNVVFPLWYNFWQAQGIDETRERVENTFQSIQSIDIANMDASLSAINIAINESHQSGQMSDYIEQETGDSNIRGTLKMLTDGYHNSDWDKQLLEVGAKIPKNVVQDNRKRRTGFDKDPKRYQKSYER